MNLCKWPEKIKAHFKGRSLWWPAGEREDLQLLSPFICSLPFSYNGFYYFTEQNFRKSSHSISKNKQRMVCVWVCVRCAGLLMSLATSIMQVFYVCLCMSFIEDWLQAWKGNSYPVGKGWDYEIESRCIDTAWTEKNPSISLWQTLSRCQQDWHQSGRHQGDDLWKQMAWFLVSLVLFINKVVSISISSTEK